MNPITVAEKSRGERDAGERREQEAPAPRAGRVGHERHQDDAAKIERVGGPERTAHGVPIHAPEEEEEQADGQEQGEPDPPAAHLEILANRSTPWV